MKDTSKRETITGESKMKCSWLVTVLLVTTGSLFAVNFDPPLNQGVNFPETPLEETSTIEMTATNNGNVQATIRFNEPGNDVFDLNPAQLVLAGGQEGVIEFTFTPDELGDVQVRLDGSIAYDMMMERISTTLRGTGIEAGDPAITVDPDEVILTLQEPGQNDEVIVTIGNEGEGRLIFEIDLAEEIDWLNIEPLEGLLRHEEELDLTVSTTDAVPDSGTHTTEFIIRSNDPENGEITVNVQLSVEFFVEFVFDREEISQQVEPDFYVNVDFEVSNGGNATLNYQVDRRLVGDANADPWEVRYETNAEEIVDDDQLNGVVVIDGLFYVSGGNNGEDINKIYVFDSEGNNVGEFDQFVESYYGMRDLTWDGRLIWGADETTLYGFNTDGEHVETIDGRARSYRSLTWDPDRNLFWSANLISNIYSTDLEGNAGDEIENINDMRIYGLSYYADDPDGYCLYVCSRGEEVNIQVNKINVDNGDMIVVREIDSDGHPGGININNQFDVLSWVLASIVQSPDQIVVWQLAGRRDWIQIDPFVGWIEVDASELFSLTLNGEGLPEGTYRGELVFREIYGNAEAVLPVTMEVDQGRIPNVIREIDLPVGWSMVSVNIQPNERDVEVLLADLVENNQLIMMKDDEGHFYRPDAGFNNIPGWFAPEGYLMKMAEAATLTLLGESVLFNDPIQLHEGWQMVSYYPRFPIEATIALSHIVDHLLIAKDGFGNFYAPEWGFSNMGEMCEGRGYYLKVDGELQLVYRIEQDGDMAASQCSPIPHTKPEFLPVHAVTGENMSLLVMADAWLDGEIGVYADGELVGSGVFQGGACGIAVWGDDPMTDVIDGALDGQELEVKLIKKAGSRSVEFDVLSGKAVYSTDALAVIRLDGSALLPDDYAITSAYPNPFNATLRVDYALPEAADVNLNVYDLSGRLVAELVSGRAQAGVHTVAFDGSGLVSGVYVLRYEAAGHTSQMKVALVK